MSVFVAIVGRPNVGKSALFNRMLKAGGAAKSSAITESTPGVTRDRNYCETEWDGRRFTVIDTGGFYAEGIPGEDAGIAHQVKEQAMFAVEEADLILHLLDGKEDISPYDAELADMLRKSGKKVLWAVNKIDSIARESRLPDFYSIGADEIMPVSAITGNGFEELMEKIISSLPAGSAEPAAKIDISGMPKIAVVGMPNSGKSTLINSLLGRKRLIVSPVPGTTRDAVDSICTYYGKKYLLIDTAGIRKKAREYSLERFSTVMALKSIERADVTVIVLDSFKGVVEQDQRIAGIVEEYGKGAIFLLNKWDIIDNPDTAYKKITLELKNKIWFMNYAPYLTTSGLERKRITKIFPMIDRIISERRKRVATGELNRFLSRIVSSARLPGYRGKEVKFLYMTQVGTEPPAFAVFVNHPRAVKEQHMRYIERALRGEYSFEGTPIRIYVKSR